MDNTKSQSGERECKLEIIDILVKGYSDDANFADLDNEVADKLWELIEGLISEAREEGREELLDSIVVGIEQLKSIVTMFNPMSTEIRAKQSGEIEAYNGLLEKLSKLKDNK